MFITLAVVLGLLSLTIHELGHYEAMRRCGVRVKEVGLLGIPLPFLPSYRYQAGRTTWSVHPFVIGAYVEMEDKDRLQDLSVLNQLYIYGNGVLANFVYGFVLFAAYGVLQYSETGQGSVLGTSAIFLALAALFLAARRYIAAILPILGLPVLALVAYLTFSMTPSEAVASGNGGPAAIVALTSTAQSIASALLLAGAISVSIGLVNLIPLMPLDGGKSVELLLSRYVSGKVAEAYTIVTIPIFLLLILYSLGLDGLRIWDWATG